MIDNLQSMPYLALIAAMAVMAASAILMLVANILHINGALVLAIILAVGFITTTFASMIYDIKQTPLTEILIGGMVASLGSIVAHYMGKGD